MTTQSTVHPDSLVQPSGEAATPELRRRLRNAVETGKTRLTEWKGGFEEGVRERPIQSILIAAAVGAAIGLLVGRRSH